MAAPGRHADMLSSPGQPSELQGFVDGWLQAQPQQQVALTFVDRRRYPGHFALAALEQEMLDAAYGAREPQVVGNKLQWWVTELAEAPNTGGHHPLTRVLFADARARAIPVATWTAPVLAAMAQLGHGTATDFQTQLAAAAPLHAALAVLETLWWYGVDASAEHAARVATLGHLLHALRRLPLDVDRDRMPLPMSRLAQYGLSRDRLRQASTEQTRAVKAQLQDLLCAWRASDELPGPLGVFRAVASRSGRTLAGRAVAAHESLAVLAAEPARPGVVETLQTWRAALAWQRASSRATGHARPDIRAPG
ncbi:MAG: squalene/phytoene synthase family protein [Rhodanobacter sp.]